MNRPASLLLYFVLLGLGCAGQTGMSGGETWISLFDGQSLDGWQSNEDPSAVTVADGQIILEGPRNHLFYVGAVQNARFKNFELKADIMTWPGANSGIYFHTEYLDSNWPEKGYEVQVNNSHIGAGNYRELKKTGSLYGIRNQFKTLVKDNEWFTMHIIVQAQRVRILVNDVLVVDYVEPKNAPRTGSQVGRLIGQGTFALQGHDPDSKVAFKNIMVRPLPDNLPMGTASVPLVDENYALIARLNAANFPIIDHHVHLKGTLTMADALAKSMTAGIYYGVAANCGIGFPITDDAGIYAYLESMEGQPVFIAMQAEGREWVDTFSPEAIAQFDYVFSDALTFTDDEGRRTRLWLRSEVVVGDKEEFMDMYVNRIQSVMNDEPIDVFVNPTFLPAVIADEYDELWTGERMQKVIDAAVANDIAIEINARYEIPSATFIKQAKAAGAKFTFGTNNGDENFGSLEYCLDMLRECDLTASDMFVPDLEP